MFNGGSQPPNGRVPYSGGLFGSGPAPNTTPTTFGNPSAAPPPSSGGGDSLFGGSQTSTTPTLFGNSSANPVPSNGGGGLFGGTQTRMRPTLFGGNSSAPSSGGGGGLFGSSTAPNTTPTLFGGGSTISTPSSSRGSRFGGIQTNMPPSMFRNSSSANETTYAEFAKSRLDSSSENSQIEPDGRVRPAKRKPLASQFDYTKPQIKIIVGQNVVSDGVDIETFYAHEALLRTHSDFFDGAFSHDWLESQGRMVSLPDALPESFKIFLNFIHTGDIYCTIDYDDSSNDTEFDRLASAWLLGDGLMSTSFQDAVIDVICDKIKEVTPVGLHHVAYPYTAGPNALRRLAVDLVIWRWKPEDMKNQDTSPAHMPAFLQDGNVRWMETSKKERKGLPPFTKEDCTYHQHVAAGKPCYRTLFK